MIARLDKRWEEHQSEGGEERREEKKGGGEGEKGGVPIGSKFFARFSASISFNHLSNKSTSCRPPGFKDGKTVVFHCLVLSLQIY